MYIVSTYPRNDIIETSPELMLSVEVKNMNTALICNLLFPHTHKHTTKYLICLIFRSFHTQVLPYYGFSVVGRDLLSKYRISKYTAVQCIQQRVILDLDASGELWGEAKNVKERTCRLLLVPIERPTLTLNIKKTHLF